MTISWVNSEGQTGIAENAYDFAMQHASKGDSSSDGEAITQPSPAEQPTGFHEQLASFQQRLDATPPEEAGALRKFLGSLNILPAPNKPQEEWSAKEHLGVILNQAMAGMGAGWRGAGTIAPRNFKAAFNKIEPPANANEPGGVPGISRQINPTAAEEAALMDSWNNMVKESRKADLKVIEGGGSTPMKQLADERTSLIRERQKFDIDTSEFKTLSTQIDNITDRIFKHPEMQGAVKYDKALKEQKRLTTETEPQLQQAQHKGPSEIVPPKTMTTPAIEQLTKYEELSSQGKTTKQIVKGTKLDPEQVREALGRDNLAIAAFNSENALTNSYFKSLERLDPALGEALKKQVSVKDLKRYTRGLPEERLRTIFEELPSHVKEAFESGEQRRLAIDTGKKSKIIPRSIDQPNTNKPITEGEVKAGWNDKPLSITKAANDNVNSNISTPDLIKGIEDIIKTYNPKSDLVKSPNTEPPLDIRTIVNSVANMNKKSGQIHLEGEDAFYDSMWKQLAKDMNDPYQKQLALQKLRKTFKLID